MFIAVCDLCVVHVHGNESPVALAKIRGGGHKNSTVEIKKPYR